MEAFDDLTHFAHWFLQQPIGSLTPPGRDAVYDFDELTSMVLYRKGEYQVELFLVKPLNVKMSLPGEHRHPNVDSFEYHLSGDLRFSLNGQQLVPTEQCQALNNDGTSWLCGKHLTRIKPTDWHGATIGAKSGGAFLSIQKWLNGVQPTSVGMDWEGKPHAEKLKKGMEKYLNDIVSKVKEED